MRRNAHSSNLILTTIAFNRGSIKLGRRIFRTSLVAIALVGLAILQPTQLFVQPVQAQFATPTVNGAIGVNEYGDHADGQNRKSTGSGQDWYMTWDDSNLYVAITNANLSESAVIYIDRNPVSPVNGGTNADGNLAGFNYDNTSFAALPFRADFVAYFKDGYREFRTANGSGGWSSQTAFFGSYASGAGNVRELAIPWSSITGGGRPSSFLFFGYLTSPGGFVYGQVPQENAGAFIGTSATYTRYYTVSNTANGTSTKPFSINSTSAGGDIQFFGLRHDTFEGYYRSPFGAVSGGSNVTLRFRTDHFDVDGVLVRVYTYNPATDTTTGPVDFPMTFLENRTENSILYDIWTRTLTAPAAPAILYYKFRITDGADTAFYSDSYADDHDNLNQGGEGAAADNEPFPAFQITVYDASFETPEWLRNANVYQIFPDRFRNGDSTNDYCVLGSTSGCPTFYGDQTPLPRSPWNVAIGDPREPDGPFENQYGTQFYGGDLAGITAKLDYLQGLGVDTIYLNPIFKARSNHRYDTDNYLEVDPALGGDPALAALVAETEKRGMRLIFDGVFNHSSSDSLYFDRYHRYGPPDGGCESTGSPYRTWYNFFNSNVPCTSSDYEGWFGFDSLPAFADGNPDVRSFFYRDTNDSVTKYWFDRGAAGWRFDVAPDISHNWWHDYRPFAKAYKADGALIGENFPDASQYLAGDQLDSVMNYRFRKNVLGFARGVNWSDNDNNGGNTIVALTPSQFDRALKAVREDYPAQATAAMLNLLDSHDTNRALYVLTLLGDSGLVEAKERLKLSALFQFTYPGAPMIYYGDEGALNSPSLANGTNGPEDDPYNRAPYPWSDEAGDEAVYGPVDNSVLSFYTTLAHLRKQFTALRTGLFESLLTGDTTPSAADNNTYAFGRVAGSDKAVVILNNGSGSNTASIPVGSYFADGTQLQDALSGASFTVSGGSVNITLVARTGAVLLPFPAAVDLTPPVASIGVDPAANENGWWKVSPTVTLSATDGGSGVRELRYWINAGSVTVVLGSSASFSIDTEGITTINLRAVDNAGNISELATQVIRLDTTAPQITLTTNTLLLSPPNHAYRTFSIADLVSAASDNADTSVDINDVVISSVTSDEPEDAKGNGDGKTRNDIVIAADCRSVMLRGERSEGGDGRLYQITLMVKDAAGNVGTAMRQVFVPVSTGNPVIDSGVQYTVTGCSL